MSYILDALRRSQAERERGQVPGLHAQLAPLTAGAPALRSARWLLWLGGAAALLLLASIGAVLLSRRAPVSAAPPAEAPAHEVRPTMPAAVPVSAAPALPAVSPGAAPARETPSLPLVVSAPPALHAEPPPAPASAPQPVPVRLSALTPAQRAAMPALGIGGSVWSENASSRFVIVNGQVVHEGEAAAPDVVVERIGQHSAIVRWRGLRIEVPF